MHCFCLCIAFVFYSCCKKEKELDHRSCSYPVIWYYMYKSSETQAKVVTQLVWSLDLHMIRGHLNDLFTEALRLAPVLPLTVVTTLKHVQGNWLPWNQHILRIGSCFRVDLAHRMSAMGTSTSGHKKEGAAFNSEHYRQVPPYL